MLIEPKLTVNPIRVNHPPNDSYPHYRITPLNEDAGKYHCLLFFVTASKFLVLAPRLKRYQIINRLTALVETAPLPVFEMKEPHENL